MGQDTQLAHKMLSSIIVVNPVIEILTVVDEMHVAVKFVGNVENLPAF